MISLWRSRRFDDLAVDPETPTSDTIMRPVSVHGDLEKNHDPGGSRKKPLKPAADQQPNLVRARRSSRSRRAALLQLAEQ